MATEDTASTDTLLGGGGEAEAATTPGAGDAGQGGEEKPEGQEGQPKAGSEGDDKAAEGKEGEGKEGEGKEKPEGAPEKYEFALPEGYEGQMDEKAIGEFEPVARELGLTNEQANRLIAIQANAQMRAQQEQQEQITQTMETWASDLRKDSEFGGANFDSNVKTAQKAMEAFGSPELKQILNDTGLGSHPELVKVFHRIGKAISEDSMEKGGGAGGQRSAAEIMYGKGE